ncbi:hypothetical protein [Streptomyces sp. NPDC005046]
MPPSNRKGTDSAMEKGPGRGSRVITDEASFEALTSEPSQIAALYFYLQMDHVVCAAHRVALSSVERPQMYTRLHEKTSAGQLARLRARYGHDEHVPNRAQRAAVFEGAFQESATHAMRGTGDFSFPKERDLLLDAACKYAERVYDTGVDLLLASVRNALLPLQSYLQGLHGDTLVWSVEETLGGITRHLAYPVLHDAGISAVFGVTTPPSENWPFIEDTNADRLLEEIDRQLPLPDQELFQHATRAVSSSRHRVALRGAEAIAAILEFPQNGPTEQLVDLTSKCYLWATALRGLGPAQQIPQAPEYAG